MHIHLSKFLKNSLNIENDSNIGMFALPERTYDKYLEIHNIDDNDIDEHTFEKYLLESGFQLEYDYEKLQNYQRNIYINETIGESWNYTRLIDKIKDKFDIYDLTTDNHWIEHNNVTAFSFYCDKDIRNDDKLMHVLDVFNYYILVAKKTNNEWFFKIDPRKPKEITNKIYNENNGILYHILTNEQYLKSIKRGLNPRKIDIENIEKNIKNDNYEKIYRPHRRFFISNKNLNECRIQLLMLKESLSRTDKNNEYIIIRIDLKKFKHKLKFFVDSTADGYSAYFTLDYIPAQCIEKININDLRL